MSEENGQPAGDSGGAYVLPGKGGSSQRNDRMERRAIMEKWGPRPEFLQPLVNRQIKIALDPNESARESTRAFMAVVKAREQDLKIDEMENGTDKPALAVNVNVDNTISIDNVLTQLSKVDEVEKRITQVKPSSNGSTNGSSNGHAHQD